MVDFPAAGGPRITILFGFRPL